MRPLQLLSSVVSREGGWHPERWSRRSQLLHQSRAFERNLAGMVLAPQLELLPLTYLRRMNSSFLTSLAGSHGFWLLVQQKPRTPTPIWVSLRLRPVRIPLHPFQTQREFHSPSHRAPLFIVIRRDRKASASSPPSSPSILITSLIAILSCLNRVLV